jgi:hypothetical protein
MSSSNNLVKNNLINSPSEGYLFEDAREGDLLISSTDENTRVLVGVKKWTEEAAIMIDEANVTNVSRGLRVSGGDTSFSGGRVTLGGGAVFSVSDVRGNEVFNVDADGSLGTIRMKRDVVADCNVELSRNLRVKDEGTFSVGSRFSVDSADIRLTSPDVNVNGKLSILGDMDTVGQFVVRPINTDGSGADRTVPVVAIFDRNAIDLNRDTVLNGSVSAKKLATLHGGLTVRAHNMNVLKADGNIVDIFRDSLVRGNSLVRGTLEVGGGVNARLLTVRDGSVHANRDFVVSGNSRLQGNAWIDGSFRANPTYYTVTDTDGNETIARGEFGWTVDENEAFVRRHLEMSCNASVLGNADVGGDFRVWRRAGGSGGDDTILSVSDARIVAERSMNITGDLGVRGNAQVVGDLSVKSGSLPLMSVNGLKVDIERDTRIGGDVSVVGSLAISRNKLGTPNEELLLSLSEEAGFVVNRDARMECNLYVGDSISIGSNIVVGGSSFDIQGNTSVNGNITTGAVFTDDGTINYDLDVGCNFRVFGRGISTSNYVAALDVSDDAIIASRNVRVTGELEVTDGPTRLVGELLVSPDGAPLAFHVQDAGILALRDFRVSGDTMVEGGLRVEGEGSLSPGLFVQKDAKVHGDLTVNTNSGTSAFKATSSNVEINRDVHVHCNLDVLDGGDISVNGGDVILRQGGDMGVLGGDLAVRKLLGNGAPLFLVRGDVLYDPGNPSSPILSPGFIVGNRRVEFSCNIQADQNVVVNKDLTVGGDVHVSGDISAQGEALVQGGLFAVEFPTLGNATLFRVSEMDGIDMNRAVRMSDGLTVGGAASGLVVQGNTLAKGSTNMFGALFVRPNGESSTSVLSVLGSFVDISREVRARCNMKVGGDLALDGRLEVGRGMRVDGEFSVDPGSGEAFLVTDDRGVIVSRPVKMLNFVNVNDGMYVRDDVRVGGDTTVMGNLNVRPQVGASPLPINTALSVTDAIIDASRDVEARCNLVVRGAHTTDGYTRMNSAADVLGRFRVFPGGQGMVSPALQVLNFKVTVSRDLEVEGDVVMDRNIVVGKAAVIGSNLSVEGDVNVTGSVTTNNVNVSGLRVTGDTSMVGPISIRPGSFDGSLGFDLNDVRLSIDRDVFAGCNLRVSRDLEVVRDATIRGDLSIKNALSLAGNFTTRGDATVEGSLSVNEGLTVTSGIIRFFGEGVARIDKTLDVRPDGVFRVLHVTDQKMTVSRPFTAMRSAEVGTDLTVRSNATVRCNMSVGRDLTVQRDSRVRRNASVNCNLTVGGSTTLMAPLEVFPDTASTPILNVRDTGVSIKRDARIDADLTVASNMTLVTGLIRGPTGIFIDGNVDIDGNIAINEDLVVAGELGALYANIGDGGLDVSGPTTMKDSLNVEIDGSSVLNTTQNAVHVGPLLETDGDVSVRGGLEVREEVLLEGGLTVYDWMSIDGDMRVVGDAQFDAAVGVDAHQTRVYNTYVRRFAGSFKEVCLLRNQNEPGISIYGGAYTVSVDIVYDQRESRRYFMAIRRDMTAGQWRLCLPANSASADLGIELEARSTNNVTTFRVVNVNQDVSIPNFTSDDIDEVPFTFVIKVTHNSHISLIMEELETEGAVPGVSKIPFPTTPLTQRASRDNAGRVGVNLLAPEEELDVSRKIQARDQFLGKSSSDGASIPGYSFTGNSNTGLFSPAINTVALGTAGVEHIRLTPTGRVGLDVTNPAENLDVLRKIQARNQFLGFSGGTAEVPSYSFTGKSNVGIFMPVLPNGGGLAMSTSGIERLRVLPTGNIGIRVQTPLYALDVGGKVQARDQFLSSSGGAETAPAYSFANDDQTGAFQPASGNWAVSTTGSERLRISPSGRVGINVKNPVVDLDVLRKVQAGDQFLGFRDGDARRPSYSFTSDMNTGIFRPMEDVLALTTGGLERVRVGPSGNVGINVKDAQEDLDVRENVQCRRQFLGLPSGTEAMPAYSFTDDPSTGMFTPVENELGLTTNGVEHIRLSANGNVGINVKNPTEQLDVNAKIQARNQFLGYQGGSETSPAYSFTVDTDTGAFQPYPDNWAISTAGKERMRVIPNGFVGVNVRNPVEGLDVGARVQAHDQFLGTQAGSASRPAYSFTQDTNMGMYRLSHDALGFSTNASQRMRIDQFGNVGIGIPAQSPVAEQLDVARKIQAGGQVLGYQGGSAQQPAFSFTGDIDTGVFRPSDNAWSIATAGVERLRVLPNGNIGINAPNADERLDVGGNIRTSSQFLGQIGNSAVNPSFSWSEDRDTGMFLRGQGDIGISTSGNTRMVLDPFGRVGVGKTDPRQPLDVEGNIRATNGDIIANNIRTATTTAEGFVTITHNFTSNLNNPGPAPSGGWNSVVASGAALNKAYEESRRLRASATQWTGHINNWDGAGHITFRKAVVVGMASRHRNSREDRRFKLAYRELSDLPDTPELGWPGISD